MRNKVLASVLILTAATAVAAAQDVASETPSKVVVATVTESGRVVISPQPDSGPQPLPTRFGRVEEGPKVIGRADVVAAADCPESAALEVEAAIALVLKVAEQEKFYPELVLAVARNESRFDSIATSPKGAYGLMQLMEGTAAELGVDRCDPEQNVRGGVKYLRTLLERYENPVTMLAAYNAGPGTVDEAGGVPPLPETLNYIANIMSEYPGWRMDSQPSEALRPVNAEPTRAARANGNPRRSAAQAGEKQEPAKWKSGFVMSFDERN